jgi:hypothetical protein
LSLNCSKQSQTINPYIVNIIALKEVDKAQNMTKIKTYLVWYLDHLNYPDLDGLTGTIYDYEISETEQLVKRRLLELEVPLDAERHARLLADALAAMRKAQPRPVPLAQAIGRTIARNRIAYTITKSLAGKGVKVITSDSVYPSMTFFSKYSNSFFTYPSYTQNPISSHKACSTT